MLSEVVTRDGLADCLALWVPDARCVLDAEDHWLRETFRDRLWIAVELLADGRQAEKLARFEALMAECVDYKKLLEALEL